jgi:iron(III) transport system permease protein
LLGLAAGCGGLGACPPGRARGAGCWAGLALGLGGLLASGFLIGAKGWSFAILNACSATWPQPVRHGRRRAGAADLLMLMAFGIARLGFFKGDLFVAGRGRLRGAAGHCSSPLRTGERLGSERVWGLAAWSAACAAAWPGTRCSWPLLTAAGTTVLGTLMALMAERGPRGWQRR